jgi:hypothetical protein
MSKVDWANYGLVGDASVESGSKEDRDVRRR